MRFRALVFDLDGTLVDSIPDIADVFNSVLAENGFPVHPDKSYRHFVGWGLVRALELALPGPVDKNEFSLMLKTVARKYNERPARLSVVYEGIRELLDDLHRRKVPMIIYTNKDAIIAGAVIDALFPVGMFDEVLGMSENIPAKPDPAALLDYIGRKGIDSSSILLVGDTPVDHETAVNCGVMFAGVTWGFRTAEELEVSGSRLNFDAPEQLHRWLLEKDDLNDT
jgi:phosphoglycolate phosphatase